MKNFTIVLLAFFFALPHGCLNGQDEKRIAELKEIIDYNNNNTATLDALLEITQEHLKGEVLVAKDYGERALNLARELQLKEQEVRAYYNLAEIYFQLREFDSVMIMVDKGREILSGDNTIPELLGLLNHVESAVYTLQGRYDQARELLYQSLQLFTKLGDTCKLASTFNRIGILYNQSSNYDSAIYYYIESSKKYSDCRDSAGLAKVLMNAGNSYTKLNDYNKALKNYLEAEKILQSVKKKRMEANIYNSVGKIYVLVKNYDSAFLYFDKALILFDSLGLLRTQGGYIYNNMGVAYEELNNFDKAFENYSIVNQIAHEINDTAMIVIAKKNLAVIYERWGQYDKALKMYDTSLMIAKKFEHNSSIVHTYFNIYRTWALKGDYKKAYEYQEIYNHWRDSIFNMEKTKIIYDLEVKYETEKKQAKILILQNESLKKDIEIRKKRNEFSMAVISGVGAVTLLLLLLFLFLLRSKKNRIIKEKEIQRLKEETKALAAKSLIHGQEEERKRVARELHDGIGILLSTVKMQFTNFIDKNPKNSKMLEKATSALDEASKDVRRISHNMMPGILSKLGLNEAIEDLFEEINETTDINAECLIEGKTTRLPENIEIMIFRIIQEIVNNVLKHAKASQISLVYNFLENEIRIQCSDNGKGFNVEETLEKKTMGISSITSRVNFLGGELNIESNGEKGTKYMIVVPYSNT